MSLVIDALRLGVIEALRTDPVIAALVEGRVYDSRIDAYSEKEATPAISVFTEEDTGEGWSANNGGPPFRTIVDLVLEVYLSFRAFSDTGEELVGYPQTSRETEVLLGILRSRCEDVIAVGESAWSRRLRHLVIRRVAQTGSKRFKTDDALVRSAVRVVTLKVEIKEERHDDAGDFATGPFHALPDPLRSICAAMPAGSSGHKACELMQAALLPAIAAPVPLAGADMTIRPGPRPRPDPSDGAEFGAEATIP